MFLKGKGKYIILCYAIFLQQFHSTSKHNSIELVLSIHSKHLSPHPQIILSLRLNNQQNSGATSYSCLTGSWLSLSTVHYDRIP